jgi:hypothetical protein
MAFLKMKRRQENTDKAYKSEYKLPQILSASPYERSSNIPGGAPDPRICARSRELARVRVSLIAPAQSLGIT